jgi:hypothetical protein
VVVIDLLPVMEGRGQAGFPVLHVMARKEMALPTLESCSLCGVVKGWSGRCVTKPEGLGLCWGRGGEASGQAASEGAMG